VPGSSLAALESTARLVGIQAVHLVAAVGEERGRSPASLTSVEVAVKEKLLGAVPNLPAVVGMRRQWPLSVPVGHHGEGETTTEKGARSRIIARVSRA
jgi:hypothetical protein